MGKPPFFMGKPSFSPRFEPPFFPARRYPCGHAAVQLRQHAPMRSPKLCGTSELLAVSAWGPGGRKCWSRLVLTIWLLNIAMVYIYIYIYHLYHIYIPSIYHLYIYIPSYHVYIYIPSIYHLYLTIPVKELPSGEHTVCN